MDSFTRKRVVTGLILLFRTGILVENTIIPSHNRSPFCFFSLLL